MAQPDDMVYIVPIDPILWNFRSSALGYYEFGSFRIFLDQRRLTMNGLDVRIGGRTFDVLLALVERHGQIVSRDELGRLVWPHTHVVDSALRFQINSLRTILAQGSKRDFISSVAGRGYCFTADVSAFRHTDQQVRISVPSAPATIPQLIGREMDQQRLLRGLDESRLVSIVGPGGIGKTSLAVAIATDASRNSGNTEFIDLATVNDDGLVSSAVASALGLGVFNGNPVPGIVAHLQGKQRLLVWDNCEHIINGAAELAEQLLRDVPNLAILATSREPLRVDGEHVYRLGPLSFPDNDNPSKDSLGFDAVKLFVEKTRRDEIDWANAENMEAAADICRALEGIPLAIEMAAMRVSDLGLATVSRLLNHSLSILTKNLKSAPDRHQTMRQTLDWSFETLSRPEADALRRMSVFSGPFTRDAAFAVAGGQYEGTVFCTSLSDLIYKSLVAVDITRTPELYRLQQITREYAGEKIEDGRERDQLYERHDEYVLQIAKQAEIDLAQTNATAWRQTYSRFLSDVRTAMDRSFRSQAPERALRLVAESSALWVELGLFAEYRGYLDKAVTLIPSQDVDPTIEMKIMATFAMVSHHTEGASDRTRAAIKRTLELADSSGNTAYQQRALTALASERLTAGSYKEGLHWAKEFERRFGDSNPNLSNRTVGHSLQHNAQFAASTMMVKQGYLRTRPNVIAIQNSGVQYDERLVLGTILSRNLWIQGLPDQSLAVVKECIDHAVTTDHSTTIGMSFSTACVPLSLIMGDIELAAYANSILLDHATRHSLLFWLPAAEYYQLAIDARSGTRSNTYEATANRLTSHLVGPLLEVSTLIGDDLMTDETLARAENGKAEWCQPELIRLAGERLRAKGKPEADRCFLEASQRAADMGALSYELRAEISLARHWLGTARETVGLERLGAVYARFDEGFSSRDLVIAESALRTKGARSARNSTVA